MNFLRRLKIGPRLAAGFAILVLLMAAVAAIGATQIRAVNQGMEALMQERDGKVELINDIQKLFDAKAKDLPAQSAQARAKFLEAREENAAAADGWDSF